MPDTTTPDMSSSEKDDAILAALQDPDDHRSRNRLAKDFRVNGSRIKRVADANGLQFDTSRTELATQANAIILKDEAQKLAGLFLVRTREALEAMGEPASTVPKYVARTENEPGGWKSKRLDVPTTADQRNLMVIAGIGVQRARELMATTTNADVDAGVSLVGQLGAAFTRFAAEATVPADEDPTVLP